MRKVKTFDPEQRRYIEENFFCGYCGNTNQWQIDVKLKHIVRCFPDGFTVTLDEKRVKRIKDAIQGFVRRRLDENRFRCANCGNTEIEYHEYYLESCWNMDCPGCFHCGNWIDKESLIEFCKECITKHNGDITDDDCFTLCEHYDFGLSEVRDHYDLSLETMKRDLSYV
jgi:hypothetical protein